MGKCLYVGQGAGPDAVVLLGCHGSLDSTGHGYPDRGVMGCSWGPVCIGIHWILCCPLPGSLCCASLTSGMAALLGCGSGVGLGTRAAGVLLLLSCWASAAVLPDRSGTPGIRVWGTGSWAEVVTSAHGCPSLQGAAWVLPPRPLGLEVPSVDGHPPSGSLTGLPWNLRLRRLEPGGWLSGRLCCLWVAGAALVAAGASTVAGSSRLSSLAVGSGSSAGTLLLVLPPSAS